MQYFSADKLQDFAQKTVDAITSVLNMQSMIVDSDIRRIAGTGTYSENIGECLPAGYVFRRVIAGGQVCFIENPGKSRDCEECIERDICKEKATLLVPIKAGAKVMGGMGLTAMTEGQKDDMLLNLGKYTDFMATVADLFAAKITSYLETEKNKVLAHNLNTIIEAYPYGIMSFDGFGVVTDFNRNAELILNTPAKGILNRQYTEKLSCELLEKSIYSGLSYEAVKAVFNMNDGTAKELILSIHPIIQDDKLQKVVCFFQEYKEQARAASAIKQSVKYSFSNIQGQSVELKRIKDLIKRIAPSNSTVLITGESGTGKELFAKAIHYESNRGSEQFIAINCSAIPDNLLESELFGYSRGAFTNANASGKMGKFELANKGTIFLDEIGDMPLNLQAKLLRVLQEKKIERLGDTKSIDIDIRIVAATNKDLKELISSKLFREDLYYRLNVIPMEIPPLRERKSDVPILAKYFLEKYNSSLLKNIRGFLPETMAKLNSYCWPGNVRELENAIEYAVNMELGEFIQLSSIPYDILSYSEKSISKIDKSLNSLQNTINELEKSQLRELLLMYGTSTDSKRIIANKLNISLSTLYRKLKMLND